MVEIKIMVPDEIAHHAPDLQWFVETMVRKLHINRHKDNQDFDLPKAFKGLNGEVFELRDAIRSEGQFEAALEAVDVANMAWLICRKCLHETKANWQKFQASIPQPDKGPEDVNSQRPMVSKAVETERGTPVDNRANHSKAERGAAHFQRTGSGAVDPGMLKPTGYANGYDNGGPGT